MPLRSAYARARSVVLTPAGLDTFAFTTSAPSYNPDSSPGANSRLQARRRTLYIKYTLLRYRARQAERHLHRGGFRVRLEDALANGDEYRTEVFCRRLNLGESVSWVC